MRLALAAAVLSLALAAAGGAAALPTPGEDRYQPIDVQMTWSAEAVGTQCFSTGECFTQRERDSSAFSQIWSLQPSHEIRADLEGEHAGSDESTVSCASDTGSGQFEPEKTSRRAGGGLQLLVKLEGGTFEAHMPFGCTNMNAVLKAINAPTAALQHDDLSAAVVHSRDIPIADDGTKTYTGTDGDIHWTVVENWHVKARYLSPCTGLTHYTRGGGFTRVWGKAPFCLDNQAGSPYACDLAAARKGDATCAGNGPRGSQQRLCSLVKIGEISQLLGGGGHTYSDRPHLLCALQGRRGQILAYRGDDEPLYHPLAQELSFARLLAAGGYAHYKLSHAGGGRLLQVLGSRPWVASWFGYRKGQTLYMTGVPGDTLPAKIASGVARITGRMLARL
jgi:hypothetical protein